MFLSYVHSLRAIAIILVVAWHCLPLFEWDPTHWQDRLIRSLIASGTIFFVFIGGFLFQHLSGRFEYRRYLSRRLQFVLLPYIFVSLPMLFALALRHRGTFDPRDVHHLPTVVQNAAWSLLTGDHILAPFWFIPMIFLFYLLAPAFLWIDRHERFYYLLPFLLAAAICVHRPDDLDNIWHSSAYYFPVYLYGMWFSHYHDRAMAFHDRWFPALTGLAVGLTWFEVFYAKRPGFIQSATMFSTEHGIVDTSALQKVLLCGVLLVALRRFGNVLDRPMEYLAEASFGVYFVHMYFIIAYVYLTARNPFPLRGLGRYSLTVTGVVALSAACLWLAKQVLGRHSRRVVGF